MDSCRQFVKQSTLVNSKLSPLELHDKALCADMLQTICCTVKLHISQVYFTNFNIYNTATRSTVILCYQCPNNIWPWHLQAPQRIAATGTACWKLKLRPCTLNLYCIYQVFKFLKLETSGLWSLYCQWQFTVF